MGVVKGNEGHGKEVEDEKGRGMSRALGLKPRLPSVYLRCRRFACVRVAGCTIEMAGRATAAEPGVL
jgi:hypothetical protein